MFDGCGESITYELTNFNKGWLLKILILILYMCYSYIFKSNKAKLVSLLLILFFYQIYSWLYKCFNKFVVNYDYNVYIDKDCLPLLQYTGKNIFFAGLAPGQEHEIWLLSSFCYNLCYHMGYLSLVSTFHKMVQTISSFLFAFYIVGGIARIIKKKLDAIHLYYDAQLLAKH